MVVFVYLDPAVVREAAAAGELGWGVLAATLRAVTQNCVALTFDDYRWEADMKREVDSTNPCCDRAFVKAYLATLAKRNRIVPCFRDDYSNRQELALVIELATTARPPVRQESRCEPEPEGPCAGRRQGGQLRPIPLPPEALGASVAC